MFKFNSLKKKLLWAFIIVILSLLLLDILLIVFHFTMINKYRSTTNNLVIENEFMQTVPELIQAYGNVVNSPRSTERLTRYDEIHANLENSMAKLDKTIIYKDSALPYSILKNIVQNLMKECDAGIIEINNNNLSAAFNRYGYVSSKNTLITVSTANLMAKEISYAKIQQSAMDKTNWLISILSLVFLGLVLFGCLVFIYIFSNSITKPLTELAALTKEISGGNLNVKVTEKLLKNHDETGVLSISIAEMINRINKEIDSQKKISDDLMTSRKDLVSRNEELEKFNKMVVDRELKMIALKSRIKELEEKQNKGV
jgi:methyl-accepting chemotaxis protein